MKGLVYKDLCLLRSMLKNYVPLLLIYGFIAAMSESASFLITMVIVVLMVLPTTISTLDEYAKWDAFAAVLPVPRRAVVGARYVFSLLLIFGAMGFSLLLTALLPLVPLVRWTFAAEAPGILVGGLVGLLFSAVTLPFHFKYGAAKARVAMLVACGLVAGCIALFSTSGLLTVLFAPLSIAEFFTKNSPVFVLSVLLVPALALPVASWLLSCRFYEKREF